MTAGAIVDDRRRTVVGRDGRAKAFRPLSAEAREEAFRQGVAAYERGDFFLAHEHLEPAWMGTDDLAERALHQGLIKLAAAYGAALDLPAIISQIEERLRRLAADPDDGPVDPPLLTRSDP
jgi:hypothetical protein